MSTWARSISSCPLSYRYSPKALANRVDDISASVLFVVGGLYGNPEAFAAVERRVAQEPGAVVVFNGDFNFFNANAADWEYINAGVRRHHAITGNVEVEAADPSSVSLIFPVTLSQPS